jgi:hypothetical protein
MRNTLVSTLIAASLLVWSAGCSKKSADTSQQTNGQPAATQTTPDNSQAANQAANNAPAQGTTADASKPSAAPAPPQVITIPQGTIITARLVDMLSTKSNSAGDKFNASLAEPIVVGGQTVANTGDRLSGTVVDAAPLGRFKGGAKLQITLDGITISGKRYALQTASVNRTQKGKGKRTGAMIGGGAGLGAIIGGIAGGGKGAAIGALVGGGAGTAGAAYTGNSNIVLPAESLLSFKLLRPVDIQ